ncbi:putative Mitogen-activated protein kinase kinase [Verrucomicrobia bacterium]|nr:putative Mitogen-activated protein kinase kinase [Verrucomicrobiota bacterium]
MTHPRDREAAVFSAARRLPAGQREDYLDQACAGDAALRQWVKDLLRANENAGNFLREFAPEAQEPSEAAVPPSPGATLRKAIAGLEKPGDRIGRYKLLQKIGQGGCGVVYMAEQEEPIRRKVALKVIKLGMDTESVITRFEAERQALALMDHPNIAKVHDAGTTDTGRPYFVMELVRGVKITGFCDENNLPTRDRLDLFVQVCQAIQHAHQKGVIHRDIKPSNILVTVNEPGSPGVPKVIDFGIAKATQGRLTDQTLFTAFEQFLGTPAYMSPEQAAMTTLDIDTRSDIYSLGVLLYELLTSKTPFDTQELLRAGLDEMRRTIREKEPIRPSTRLGAMRDADLTTVANHRQTEAPRLVHTLQGDLDWIVMKALEKDRARRYETANGFARDVQRYLADEPVVARPPRKLYLLQKLVRRNKLAFAAVASVTVALLLGLGLSTWLFAKEKRARNNEAQLRVQAQASENHARGEAEHAQASSTEAKMTLEASDFSQAVRLSSEGNYADALPYLARILSANPTNNAALTRLATLLTYHSWMVPAVILNHSNWVYSAEFSRDGKRIVTASYDFTARVWDAQTGLALTGPLNHEGWLESAEFSPNGKWVLTGSHDGNAWVWDAQSGQPVRGPLKHGGPIHRAHFSPDGTRIVTASEDGTARVWDALNGQPLAGVLEHGGIVQSAQFSPDGKRIVTASFDNTARVWDAQSGLPLTGPLRHDRTVLSAEFSPDGERIVTASWDKTARVWDAQNGLPLTGPLRHDGLGWSAQFSPDGERIVTTSMDKTARIWDARNGQLLAPLLKHESTVRSAYFSPDGERLVTASADGTARVWDVRTGLCGPACR